MALQDQQTPDVTKLVRRLAQAEQRLDQIVNAHVHQEWEHGALARENAAIRDLVRDVREQLGPAPVDLES